MSMSTDIIGIKPDDETFKKMLSAYNACKDVGIPIPREVDKYFNYDPPNEKGVIVPLFGYCSEIIEDDTRGYEIKLADLPKDIKYIQFWNVMEDDM